MQLRSLRTALCCITMLCGATAAQAQYDLIIRGGRLLDGMGNPWRYADVAIVGAQIVVVGDLKAATANRVIDAAGFYVAPGFIDVHTHAGTGLASADLSHARPLLAQGITTVVINPDGGGPTDIEGQRRRLLEHGLGVNVAQLVPQGTVREAVLQMDDRDPTDEELDRMRRIVRQGMAAGAFGLSSGLYYAPGSYATTEEVIELAKVVAEFDGVYQSHIRDEADYNIGVVAAVEEVIRIAREARLPGIVTHIKALGPRVWGFSTAIVQRIERARAQGVEVFADQYPYDASGTSITGALIPRWAQVGGQRALLARLDSAEVRTRIRAAIVENLDRRGGAGRLQFQRHEADPTIEGRTLQAVADERGMQPADLAMALLRAGGAGVVSFNMHDDDVATFMRQSWTMTSSDGDITKMGEGVPHPRWYGTFPRKIRKYVLDDATISLETAIRSMTSLSANVMRIPHRGVIMPGAAADIVVFDLERIRDKATYEDPHQLCEGMEFVLVNGRIAVDGGEFTAEMGGRVLTRGQP